MSTPSELNTLFDNLLKEAKEQQKARPKKRGTKGPAWNPTPKAPPSIASLVSKMSKKPTIDNFAVEAVICLSHKTQCTGCGTTGESSHGLFLKLTHPTLGEHDKKITEEDFHSLHSNLKRETKVIAHQISTCPQCFLTHTHEGAESSEEK